MDEIARLISELEDGGIQDTSKLFGVVYEELRRLASRKMSLESPDHSLQATALVHEAFVRMVDVTHPQRWDSQWHFFAAAAQAMRRILVERARRTRRLKHGAGFDRQPIEDVSKPDPDAKLIELDEALTRLALDDAEAATIVELQPFCRPES